MSVMDRRNRIKRRHRRIRKKIIGTPDKPRMFVYRSNRNITASLIDDTTGTTILTVTTNSKELKGVENRTKTEQAGRVGLLLAEKARKKGIETVVFDRGGYPYQGRVKEVAEKAREGGLKF
ncbi:50S ribosomal protein L18 [Candidatus Fermentibacteria bacterium]|nr:50S ribosomal protein L18 [Candidatus Fermentibacteria bacterium]